MKKAAIYILGLILVATATAALFWAAKDSKGHDDKSAVQSAPTHKVPAPTGRACQIFTADKAAALLGSGVKGGPNDTQQSSSDLDVSTCTYTQSAGEASASEVKSASLLVRIPKTERGLSSNDKEFGPLRPTTVEDVAGYGDQAYWDAEHGQLNILKNNNWYVLSYGPVSPASRSLEQTRQMADFLIGLL